MLFEPPTEEEIDRRVAEVLADPARAARYDFDGDGRVDADERARLARIVAAELRTERARRADLACAEGASGVVAGRWELERVLGEGGQAVTYLAIDRETGGQVALKRLHLAAAGDWKSVELFEREGHTLEQLDHPSIPRYLAAFDVDVAGPLGGFYLAQEYVAGEPLNAELARGRRYEEAEVRATLRELLGVLDYLHRRHPPVVHRDIKPSNLIRRPDGRIALIDFGAIQAALPTASRLGSTIIGTSGYMAPEQFMGRAEPATDLYALGATAVHLLTHRHPADLPLERMRLRWHDAARGVSQELVAFIDKLLEPALEDRFRSAAEALEALDRGPGPAVAQPTRRALTVAGAALVGLFAVLGFVLALGDTARDPQPATASLRYGRYEVPVTVSYPDARADLPAFVARSTATSSSYELLGHIDNATGLAVTRLEGRVRLYDRAGALVGSGEVAAWPTFRPPLLPGQQSPLNASGVRIAGRAARAELDFFALETAPPTPPGALPLDLVWDTAPVDGGALVARERTFVAGDERRGQRTFTWEVDVEHVGSEPLWFVQVEARFYDGGGARVATHATYVTGGSPMMPGATTPVRLRATLGGELARRELAVVSASRPDPL